MDDIFIFPSHLFLSSNLLHSHSYYPNLSSSQSLFLFSIHVMDVGKDFVFVLLAWYIPSCYVGSRDSSARYLFETSRGTQFYIKLPQS